MFVLAVSAEGFSMVGRQCQYRVIVTAGGFQPLDELADRRIDVRDLTIV